MVRRISMAGICLGLLLAVGSCDDDDPVGPEEEEFLAELTGAAERPNPVETDGFGAAGFLRVDDGVAFEIVAEDLSDDVVAAHIHGPATEEVATGVIVTLFDDPNGVDGEEFDTEGVFPSNDFPIKDGVSLDSVLVLMRTGQAYVNVHTVAHPGGEIRGQIVQIN